MRNPLFNQSIRSHNKVDKYIEVVAYADYRAMDIAVAYLHSEMDQGRIGIKDFEISGCYQLKQASHSDYVFEVHYEEL